MKYRVIIQSINQHNEMEWERIITSDISMRAAKSKATRWMKRNIFQSDCAKVHKRDAGGRRSYWELR